MNTLQIGWVGLGNMGNAIVQNLLKNGCSVNVNNRTKEKEAEKLYENLYFVKILDLFKSNFKLNNKEVSYNEFFGIKE